MSRKLSRHCIDTHTFGFIEPNEYKPLGFPGVLGMKQENKGHRKWQLRNAKALERLKLWGPTMSVYTYIKGFLMEKGEALFQMSPKGSPIGRCYISSSTYKIRASELSVKPI